MKTCGECGVTSGVATNEYASIEADQDHSYLVIHWPNDKGPLWLVQKSGRGAVMPIGRMDNILAAPDVRHALENLADAQNGPPMERPTHKRAWELAMADAVRMLAKTAH